MGRPETPFFIGIKLEQLERLYFRTNIWNRKRTGHKEEKSNQAGNAEIYKN